MPESNKSIDLAYKKQNDKCSAVSLRIPYELA